MSSISSAYESGIWPLHLQFSISSALALSYGPEEPDEHRRAAAARGGRRHQEAALCGRHDPQDGRGKAAKALTAKNTCKACAYGMGGQHGGMTNELGEFPSVCNKSVQAQSTDIQPAIRRDRLRACRSPTWRSSSGREMEQLGRLNTPLFKAAGARSLPAGQLGLGASPTPPRSSQPPSPTGRSSIPPAARRTKPASCSSCWRGPWAPTTSTTAPTTATRRRARGSRTTIGKGTATVELDDLTGADLIFVIGANPASNHPRFIHMLKHCRDRGGDVIVINPAKEPGLVKFAVPKSPGSMLKGGDEIASDWLQPRIGTDIALFKGLAQSRARDGRRGSRLHRRAQRGLRRLPRRSRCAGLG